MKRFLKIIQFSMLTISMLASASCEEVDDWDTMTDEFSKESLIAATDMKVGMQLTDSGTNTVYAGDIAYTNTYEGGDSFSP